LNVNGNAYVGGGSGVTATIFRDLNTAYFLDPDPGSDTGNSGNIRGDVAIGGNLSNLVKLDITGSGANPSWCIYMRNSNVGLQVDNVAYGVYATASTTGINATGNTWYGGEFIGAYSGVYAGGPRFGVWGEGNILSGYFRNGPVVVDPSGSTIPNTVSTTYGLDVRGSIKGNSYVSADGSVGVSQTFSAGGCTMVIKNGLVTSVTCP
jgi:hypothetical protein